MSGYWKHVGSLLTALVFLCLTGIAGCAARGSVRIYDAEYHDYHYWNHNEVVYYQQWEAETHRQDEDFQGRSRSDQDEYWRWRHQHQGHDRH